VRVTTAFNRLLRLDGATVSAVEIGDDGVVVDVRRRLRRVQCRCGYTARAFYDRSVRRWRHLDVAGITLWLRAEIRRVACPDCGVRTERVAWARPGSRFTTQFEDVMAWLALPAGPTIRPPTGPPPRPAGRYRHPLGELLQRNAVHFNRPHPSS
jgi:transposase